MDVVPTGAGAARPGFLTFASAALTVVNALLGQTSSFIVHIHHLSPMCAPSRHNCLLPFLFFIFLNFYFSVLGMEPRALLMLGECPTTDLEGVRCKGSRREKA